jgi:putative hydrolase of the HAD superfamily
VQAVLFDLGGTLLRFDGARGGRLFREGARRTYRFWASRRRLMPGFARYYTRQWLLMHLAFTRRLVTGREVDAMQLMQHSCARLGLTGSVSFYRELLWQWYKPLADRARVETGAIEALEALQRRGLKLGLVSNTFVPGFVVDRHLEQAGLLGYLPHRVYSSDVGLRKPNGRIFELAAGAMDVPPERIVFVGDQWRSDIQGARRAGLLGVHKRPGRWWNGAVGTGPRRNGADHIESLDALPLLLDRWAGPTVMSDRAISPAGAAVAERVA